MTEILGDSLAGIMPDSVSVWWSLAWARAQVGKREVALEAMAVAVAPLPPPTVVVTDGALVTKPEVTTAVPVAVRVVGVVVGVVVVPPSTKANLNCPVPSKFTPRTAMRPW
jgi:hypothetical protein